MKIQTLCCLLVILLLLSACTSPGINPSTTTTTVLGITVPSTTAPQTTVPSTASLSVYSRADTDAVEIIDVEQAGKRCMVTDPTQLDALFGLLGSTSGEYLGDTVKGFYGGTLALILYNQGEVIGRVWFTVSVYNDKEYAYFAMDRYREWDTVRYYESRYSLPAAKVHEYVTWARQFSYA